MLGCVYCGVVVRQRRLIIFLWLSELPATRNGCSLGAAFGGSFGMGRGLPNSPSAQTQQPFSCSFTHRPWSSLSKAFARNSGSFKIVSGTEKCLYVVEYDVVIPGLRYDIIFGSTWYLVLCVMYFWLLPLGNGYWDLFPCRVNIVTN